MREMPRGKAENAEKKVPLLKSHISRGLELIGQGESIKAYEHYTHYRHDLSLEGPDIDVVKGEIYPISSLLTDEDLLKGARNVARNSRAFGSRSAVIGGWYTVESMGESDALINPEKYDPKIVNQFHHEAAVVAAEEWLHLLQSASGEPLAGVADREVDVAAYLDSKGVSLSADFLTRYPARTKWVSERYPERMDEISTFTEKYKG